MTKHEVVKGAGVIYSEGYDAGTQAAAEQIFRDIDRLHLHVANEYEARAYEELKKKYGVK